MRVVALVLCFSLSGTLVARPAGPFVVYAQKPRVSKKAGAQKIAQLKAIFVTALSVGGAFGTEAVIKTYHQFKNVYDTLSIPELQAGLGALLVFLGTWQGAKFVRNSTNLNEEQALLDSRKEAEKHLEELWKPFVAHLDFLPLDAHKALVDTLQKYRDEAGSENEIAASIFGELLAPVHAKYFERTTSPQKKAPSLPKTGKAYGLKLAIKEKGRRVAQTAGAPLKWYFSKALKDEEPEPSQTKTKNEEASGDEDSEENTPRKRVSKLGVLGTSLPFMPAVLGLYAVVTGDVSRDQMVQWLKPIWPWLALLGAHAVTSLHFASGARKEELQDPALEEKTETVEQTLGTAAELVGSNVALFEREEAKENLVKFLKQHGLLEVMSDYMPPSKNGTNDKHVGKK